ncbi:cob(I)yrinic acid a,c-diamide adenosyltransferase [Candidatus Peribacteria bacterium]|nr:cob(I)yrinic acid a,c-diamide adenosyltransferase [Candidatus Peribacteria bacterium]
MKIYTRTGDKGKTGLFGGQRVPKSALRLHAYGSLDELNACLGVVTSEDNLPKPLSKQIEEIQSLLFQIGADLATPLESSANILRMTEAPAMQMEQWIDEMELSLSPLTRFILPGGSRAGAELHFARTICRRAERLIVELDEKEKITKTIIVIINRLSDYLFVAARYANKKLSAEEKGVEIPRG